ncbi:PAS domain S-box [Leptolyngbyaceae cyanobacterium JSC-12]|nr:PAS domain S-box [Leptolyngbyaceae cyanobacterium JSC-12]
MVNTTVNASDHLWFTNSFVATSQHLVAALKHLQAQSSSTLPGIVYTYDLINQQTLCSSNSLAAMLGFTPEDINALGVFGLAKLIHPDDLRAVADHFQRFITLQEGEVIAVEYRMQRADGIWCWVRSQETLIAQVADDLPQILGLVQIMTPLMPDADNPSIAKHLMDDRDSNQGFLPWLSTETGFQQQQSSCQNNCY